MKLVDLHADIGYDVLQKRKAGKRDILKYDHVPKWKEGNFDTVCMASFFDGHETWEEMQEMVLTLKEEIASCEDVLLVQKKEDFDCDKIKAVLSVEGMCGIVQKECECLDWLYKEGVILASLTWNEENALATGVKGNPAHGLKEAGIRILHQMEKHHMIIDVSHANEKTFWQIMKSTRGTVIATHSNARTLCDHVRNLYDEQALAIAKRGGLMGAVAAPWFLDSQVEQQNVKRLVEHQLYLKQLIGVSHLALGFDFMDFFDGYQESYVKGLHDASQAQNIIMELERQRMSKEDIEKIAYDNAIKVLKEAFI